MDVDGIAEQLIRWQRGKRFVVVVDAAAAGVGLARRLFDRGAVGVKLVAASAGTGEIPADLDVAYVDAPRRPTATEAIHAVGRVLADPPRWLLDELDRFDPDRNAQVLESIFLGRLELFGRPVMGGRRPEWIALEDKTIADRLWDRAGVARTLSAIVPVDQAWMAARELGSELGTVWTADNTRGWHGGGDRTRWVRTAGDVEDATRFFSELVPTVRVMPFLDGVPCSIHAIVTDRGVAVGRPIEIVVLRDPVGCRFVYAGNSNTWDPPEAVREQMRDAARRVGALLERTVGYRGAFGIDGVCTVEGFRPNELNARMTAGVAVLNQSLEGFPLGDVVDGIVAGTIDVDAGELEDLLIERADRNRIGGFGFPNVVEVEPDDVAFLYDGRRVREAVDPDGPRDGSMQIGPSKVGSYLFTRLDPHAVEAGPSIGPFAVAALRFAADRWGLEVPYRLEPAPDLCRLPSAQ